MPLNLTLTILAIALLLLLILVARLHAFLAMLITSLSLGLAAGMKPLAVLKSVQTGCGEALGFIAIVLGLGAMIGALVEVSGGGRQLADALIMKFGKERANWAVLVASFLVGLPIFFEVGFIILIPLIWSLTRESKKSLLLFGMAMVAPLTITHALVPPHPAPAAAAQLLGVDLGSAILWGTLLSLPIAILGGIVFGSWSARRYFVPVPDFAPPPQENLGTKPPNAMLVMLLLLLPVGLIVAAAFGRNVKWLALAGHPFTALTITLIACILLLGARRGMTRDQITKAVTASLGPTGTLLLIMGAGGALKQVIVDIGAGVSAGHLLAAAHIPLVIVAFIIAAALRAAQGSATVAIITAAGIVAPMLKAAAGVHALPVFLAVCLGGSAISHVNDAGFWIVNQYFGMTVPQTLRTWTLMKVLTTVVGFAMVLVLQRWM
jgi:gluconate transporter